MEHHIVATSSDTTETDGADGDAAEGEETEPERSAEKKDRKNTLKTLSGLFSP